MNIFLIDADDLSAGAWIDEAFRVLEESEGPLPVRRAYGSAENLKGLADALREANLLGMNATSTKLLKKFLQHFVRLSAAKQNAVQYLLPPQTL